MDDRIGARERVLLEMVVSHDDGSEAIRKAMSLAVHGFHLDESYQPVPVSAPEQSTGREGHISYNYIVRGIFVGDSLEDLKDLNRSIASAWRDSEVRAIEDQGSALRAELGSDCPISPCDCSRTRKGDFSKIRSAIKVGKVWSAGFKGKDVVIGIVDNGIAATGRVANGKVPNVVDGWPADWGTKTGPGEHGNMVAIDALAVAPEVLLYDLRISDQAIDELVVLSNVLQAYQWALNRYVSTGTPQVLSNSWSLFRATEDPVYAKDPNHPVTRKIEEVVSAGIAVLFAAGNCGAACPYGTCGNDTGPDRDIWGANGSPSVMTVGAVNVDFELLGYSSSGPAALDPLKPDFCGISEFKGYTSNDEGTSAACPVVAGVVALLRQAKKTLGPSELKSVLHRTSHPIGGGSGWNPYAGFGVVDAWAAYNLAISLP